MIEIEGEIDVGLRVRTAIKTARVTKAKLAKALGGVLPPKPGEEYSQAYLEAVSRATKTPVSFFRGETDSYADKKGTMVDGKLTGLMKEKAKRF